MKGLGLPNMDNPNLRHILARLSLAVIFIGIGIWEIIQPSYWSSFVPPFAAAMANVNTLVMVHGIMLLVIGLAVLIGMYLRVSAAISALIMLAILVDIITTSGFTDLVIRDLTVLLIALSLVFDNTKYLRLTDN